MSKNKKKSILVVSFGTSYNDSRERNIDAIEQTIAAAFPEYEVRRAFTSQVIIDKLKKRDHIGIDNVKEALEHALEDGITELIVQPTHLMDGLEYMELAETVEEYRNRFKQLDIGDPLLTTEEDFDQVIDAITDATVQYDDGETAICFMGHGTEAGANQVYTRLQKKLWQRTYINYYVATVEASPSITDLIHMVKTGGDYKTAVLRPLMVVAGDHANNDMAGAEEESWKCLMEEAGYKVKCIVEGLGELADIRRLYTAHVRNIINTAQHDSESNEKSSR